MRQLTSEVPKPMLKVHGKPILEHIVESLVSSGIREICIVTGFRAEVIQQFFAEGQRWNATISYVQQVVQDGTGKAPEYARTFAGSDSFLLTYGDILVRPETYPLMVERFESGDFSGLVTVTRGEDVTKGGLNLFDQDFCLTRIVEKPSSAHLDQLRREGYLGPDQPIWYNAGIYVFRPVLFKFTTHLQKSPRGEYELPDALSAMIAAGHRLAGLEIQGRWVDVRDPEVLASLEHEQS